MNDNMEAQVRENTLESITNQANVLTSAHIIVGEDRLYVGPVKDSFTWQTLVLIPYL